MSDTPLTDYARSVCLDSDLSTLSSFRKIVLLIVFCFAQFIDALNNSALFAAIPPICVDLGIANGVSVWLISAYQLTFAALLLSSGRLSDLYNPKYVFIAGAWVMSFTSLGTGFVRSEIPLIVLRALMGVGAALNVPSAMHIIVHMFPEPSIRSKALAAFAGAAALGNVIGLIIGAAIVTYASWPWVFYFITVICFIMGALVLVLLPSPRNVHDKKVTYLSKINRMDPIGVSSLTIALILFVFAVTSGSVDGWRHARTIAPIIISGALTAFFVVWEARIPEELAALPPKMWRYENFAILIVISLQPFMWWASVQLLFSWYYQEVFGWSTIITAVHFLPLGLVSFPIMGLASVLQQRVPLKWVIMIGEVLVLVGTVLIPFANTREHYWRFAFPGFCIGTAGMTIVFATTNIALFAVTPPEVAAMVGAVFTSALQLGSAAGTAIITSIQATVQENDDGPSSFKGSAAGLWFLFAFTAVEALATMLFMRNAVSPVGNKVEQSLGEQKEVPMNEVEKPAINIGTALMAA